MSATVERLWRSHGLDCAVLWVHGTHRCGYVRVDSEHPWHGIRYDEPAPGSPPSPEVIDRFDLDEDLSIVAAFAYALSSEEGRAESRRAPEFRVAVHGGLTFSGELVGEDVPGGWWFGFDCHHLDDTPAIWTEERAAQECARLAEQLSSIEVAA